MDQFRIKNIIEKLSSKELHNEDSIRLSILSMFASVPNFINCVPVCIEDIKYMIKGCNIFKYEIQKKENLKNSIDKFKENWSNILNANIIIVNNFSRLPDVIIPLQALISEENKNLFSIIALDEDAFMISKDFDIFEKFSIKTKIDYFSYMDKITRLVNEQNGEKLYLPIDEAFTKEELRYAIKNVKKVNISSDVMETLKIIYKDLEKFNQEKEEFETGIILTSERWNEIISLLKASAFLNGRDYINLSDIFLLKKILWTNKSHISRINKIIYDGIKYMINKNCSNMKIYTAEMMNLLMEMTNTFKLMKKEKNYFISNINLIEWNNSFKRIKNKITETKYYSREFFDDKNNFLNLFIDNDDTKNFVDLFKFEDKLIFDWFTRLKVIMEYINQSYYRN